jgi:4-oxalomesaconate hydratase
MNLLVFSAHAADFCSRSGGSIALHTLAGGAAHVVDLTFGERGESEDYWAGHGAKSIEEAKAVRADEARAAASALGATIEFLDFDDYPLSICKDRIRILGRILRQHRADIVLTHWQSDPYNVDHEVTAKSVMRAASLAAVPGFDPADPVLAYPQIFAFEPTVPRDDDTGFRPNHYISIDSVFERKMEALSKLRSQRKLTTFYQRCGEYRGWQAQQWSCRSIQYAEAFYRHNAIVSTGFDSHVELQDNEPSRLGGEFPEQGKRC